MFRLLLETHINTMGSLYSAVGIAAFFVFQKIEPGFPLIGQGLIK